MAPSTLDKLNPTGQRLDKFRSAELDEVLGLQFSVLDRGFVRVVDYMGGDEAIVQAARVSYGAGTKKAQSDANLVRYLVRHQHLSPLEMCEIKFHVKLPIFVARHFIRHRTASVNEMSGRYSIMEHEFYLPAEQDLNLQSTTNQQGRSSETLSPGEMGRVLAAMKTEALDVFQSYESYINAGLAREVGRINLPLSTYTQWYWKIDLRNLLNFLSLRNSERAQLEIRKYAQVMAEIVKAWCPVTYEAFNDYVVEGLHLTRQDRVVIQKLLAAHSNVSTAHESPTFSIAELASVSPGERREIIEKLRLLGFDFEQDAVAHAETGVTGVAKPEDIVETMQELADLPTAGKNDPADVS